MSPRRNRPSGSRRGAPPELDRQQLRRGVGTVEMWGHERWRVHHIPGPAAVKTYRCPGCDHEIRPGVPHVVVWPVEAAPGGALDRRHWHTACWRARDRRQPDRGYPARRRPARRHPAG